MSLCITINCLLPGAASIQWCIHTVKYSGAHRKEDSSMCLHTEQSSRSQLHSRHVSIGVKTHTRSCEGIGYQMT